MATLSITTKAAGSPELIKTQALAVLMPERKTLAPALKALDKRLGGTVKRSLQNGDFTGSAGSQLWLPGAGNVDRVLLVGCGDPGKLNAAQSKKVSEALSRALVASAAKDAQILMECLTQKLKNPVALLERMSLSLSLAHYQYGQTLNKRKKPERALKKVAIL
ncbi:MAG: M17 family peptidase N-terminal domain-containing protein, partial [Pseudomonadota bacterium]|nr:M17 family peptidase N-terminal domain-containing protein [Pseudomonadota bacterium]